MLPIEYNLVLQAADTDGIAQSQTPGAAGNLTLNGSLMSQDTLDTNGHAREILITCAGADAGRTLTITGKVLPNGDDVSEAVSGSNGSTSVSTKQFISITSVAIDAASAGAIQVGTNGNGSSVAKPLDRKINPFQASIACVGSLTGTITFGVEMTFDNIFLNPTDPVWFAHDTITAETASAFGNLDKPVQAIRTVIDSSGSGGGSVRTTILQSDSAP